MESLTATHINGDSFNARPTPCYGYGKNRHRFLVMLPSLERTHILVERLHDGSVRLPTLPTCSYHYSRFTVTDLEESIDTFLGVSVRFVRQLWTTHQGANPVLWGDTYDTIAVILVEWAEAEKSVENGGTMTWMSRSELSRANWVETEKELRLDLCQVVLEAMKQINRQVQVWVPPWRRMGWSRKTMAWVKDVTNSDVDEHELYRTFLKIMDHHHSVVWRCELDLSRTEHASVSNGELEQVFMKAAIPLFAEAKRTATVAKVLHKLRIVPHLIAVRQDECIFLQRNAGSAEGEDLDAKLLLDTLRKMQLVAHDHLDELKAGGLEVRDSHWLFSNVHELLYHKGLERAVQGSEEHEMILRDLRCREEEIKEVCREISTFAIPNTLVHGDLSPSNIGSRETLGGAGYQFFDWGLAHIGHPFIDIDVIVEFFAEDQANIERWRREYWQHWKSVVSAKDFTKLLRRVPLIGVCAGLDMFLRESELHLDEWNGLRCRIRQYAEFVQQSLPDRK